MDICHIGEKELGGSVCGVKVFGVLIFSQESRASELFEGVAFIKEAARQKVEQHINGVYFNSETCVVDCKRDISQDDALIIKSCMEKTMSPFEWDEFSDHIIKK